MDCWRGLQDKARHGSLSAVEEGNRKTATRSLCRQWRRCAELIEFGGDRMIVAIATRASAARFTQHCRREVEQAE